MAAAARPTRVVDRVEDADKPPEKPALQNFTFGLVQVVLGKGNNGGNSQRTLPAPGDGFATRTEAFKGVVWALQYLIIVSIVFNVTGFEQELKKYCVVQGRMVAVRAMCMTVRCVLKFDVSNKKCLERNADM